MAVDNGNEIQLLDQVIQSGGSCEVVQDDFARSRRLRGDAHSVGNILGAAKIFLPNDFGLTFDALTFARIPVSVSADLFLMETDRHRG
jgi:hypothetical protein